MAIKHLRTAFASQYQPGQPARLVAGEALQEPGGDVDYVEMTVTPGILTVAVTPLAAGVSVAPVTDVIRDLGDWPAVDRGVARNLEAKAVPH